MYPSIKGSQTQVASLDTEPPLAKSDCQNYSVFPTSWLRIKTANVARYGNRIPGFKLSTFVYAIPSLFSPSKFLHALNFRHRQVLFNTVSKYEKGSKGLVAAV